ncbi:indolepyruvate oxidoreductase subunit beta [Thermosulfurimonas sp. F29]|uniref:indolepyruvate oxidoreductase subunit beta n=1 Tax=Thermosulfurimonas sp. F29 TaxID=2867247 RepID=UPI001C82FC06|nr:indolepyruvate oxidoreductase subunit beta [Thermosulfurimonas sp. F29]MBX6423300.1 indolepyruvate oxidoreductase subunit beta [Thermosulfurimonas sp. F29]
MAEGYRILAVGVGGQGILLFSRVLGEAALREGYPVAMSEVHGMAQRGGVVETNIVVGAVRSPYISPGEADVLVALEPVEALRALSRCRKEATAIVSTDPVVPQIVKDGLATYPELPPLLQRLRGVLPRVYLLSGEELAQEAGSTRALNVVLLGALAATGVLPFGREAFLAALKKAVKPAYLDLNLRAFDLGWRAVESAR